MSSEHSIPAATEEIRLLLIGPPKTGQSSIANILAGANVFPVSGSTSINAPTATTQPRHYTNKKILPGKHLLIVDAPVRLDRRKKTFEMNQCCLGYSFLASIHLKRCDNQ